MRMIHSRRNSRFGCGGRDRRKRRRGRVLLGRSQQLAAAADVLFRLLEQAVLGSVRAAPLVVLMAEMTFKSSGNQALPVMEVFFARPAGSNLNSCACPGRCGSSRPRPRRRPRVPPGGFACVLADRVARWLVPAARCFTCPWRSDRNASSSPYGFSSSA